MEYWLIISFFFIALIYSSAGFGGGSSYLALLALAGIPVQSMRAIALFCNLAVVTGSVINFHLKGLRPWRDAVLILAASIPMAYIGGRIILPKDIFLPLLGVVLVLGASLMFLNFKTAKFSKRPWYSLPIVGGIIGFISGLVGIGGGIFLAPVLHLTRWKSEKEIAAMASFFIFVNSIAGLLGQFSLSPDLDYKMMFALIAAVIVGGQLGNRIVINWLKPEHIRFITALLIAFVGCRLIYNNLSI